MVGGAGGELDVPPGGHGQPPGQPPGGGRELDVHRGGHRQPPRGRHGTEAAQPERRAGAGGSQLFYLTLFIILFKKAVG